MSSFCSICNRQLDKPSDPLSGDCGGDCWGCIGETEADSGYEPSLEQVRKEYKKGLRPNWIPPPKITCLVVKDTASGYEINVDVKLVKPLGEPWDNAGFELEIYSQNDVLKEKNTVLKRQMKTDNDGVTSYKFRYVNSLSKVKLWSQVKRGGSSWAYPINEEEKA